MYLGRIILSIFRCHIYSQEEEEILHTSVNNIVI